MPERIQLRRTKGWRKPEGAIVVSRPSRWGNPAVVEKDIYGWRVFATDVGPTLGVYDNVFDARARAVKIFANTARGIWSPSALPESLSDLQVQVIYNFHRAWLQRIGGHPIEEARSQLAGKDLCCWCPLDQPCHADTLLEIANGGSRNEPQESSNE